MLEYLTGRTERLSNALFISFFPREINWIKFFVYSLEKSVKKLKNQIFESETEGGRQREELRAQLIQDHEQVLQKTMKTKEDEICTLTKELEEALDHVENLKQMRNEEMLLAENAKEQVLIMAQHEQKSLSERLHEALANLETCQKELDKHRLDANTRLEKDRCSISGTYYIYRAITIRLVNVEGM